MVKIVGFVTGLFMPRIWLINLEEVLAQRPSREHLCQQFCRYMHLVKPGDLFIRSLDVPSVYMDYLLALRELPPASEWLLKVDFHIPYSICDCIQRDRKLMDTLFQLGKSGEYVLEAYIDSPAVVQLSQKTGIPYAGSKEGLTIKLNNKKYFREMSGELGIEVAPGFSAGNLEEVESAVKKICLNSHSRAIIKKSVSGGGFGNLAGGREELLSHLPDLIDGGEYVVERLLDLEHTVGSLSLIGDDDYTFEGLDCQMIQDFSWRGCSYPFEHNGVGREIEASCRKYADLIYELGGRGILNIDWGLERQKDGKLKVFALEINFRHNGFNFIMQAARDCFDIAAEDLNLIYYDNFLVRKDIGDFEQILALADEMRLDGRSVFARKKGLPHGFLFANSLHDGGVGILIAGGSKEIVGRIDSEIKALIG